MNIYAAASYMKLGYRIRREAWKTRTHNSWIDIYKINGFYFHIEDFLENDWEVIFDGIIDDTGFVKYEDALEDEKA